jgi:ribonucleoside-diphosphate reductase alpha chain
MESEVMIESDLAVTAPGLLRVIRRNGSVTPYDDSKIAVAMTKAFLAVEGGNAAASTRIRELVTRMTDQITEAFRRRWPSGGTIHIETIQDQVELALMRAGEHKIARSYVLYREDRRRARQEDEGGEGGQSSLSSRISVTLSDGSRKPLDMSKLQKLIKEACLGLKEVDEEVILKDAERNLFDGVSLADVNQSLVMSTRALIEREPNYSFAAARLLLHTLRSEALSFLGMQSEALHQEMGQLYIDYFKM